MGKKTLIKWVISLWCFRKRNQLTKLVFYNEKHPQEIRKVNPRNFVIDCILFFFNTDGLQKRITMLSKRKKSTSSFVNIICSAQNKQNNRKELVSFGGFLFV